LNNKGIDGFTLSAFGGFSSTKNIVHLADSVKNQDDSNK